MAASPGTRADWNGKPVCCSWSGRTPEANKKPDYIELIQLLSRRGICDIDDFLENSLGVLISAVFLLLIRKMNSPGK